MVLPSLAGTVLTDPAEAWETAGHTGQRSQSASFSVPYGTPGRRLSRGRSSGFVVKDLLRLFDPFFPLYAPTEIEHLIYALDIRLGQIRNLLVGGDP